MKKIIKANNWSSDFAPYGKEIHFDTTKLKDFYGLSGIKVINIDAKFGPYIMYRKKIVDYYDVEDALWSMYVDECNEEGSIAREYIFEDKFMPKHRADVIDYIKNLPAVAEITDDLSDWYTASIINASCNGKKSTKVVADKYTSRVDYLLTNSALTDDAANLYGGGWRDGDQEELIQEYGVTKEYADDLCELFRYYESKEKADADDVDASCSGKKSVKSTTNVCRNRKITANSDNQLKLYWYKTNAYNGVLITDGIEAFDLDLPLDITFNDAKLEDYSNLLGCSDLADAEHSIEVSVEKFKFIPDEFEDIKVLPITVSAATNTCNIPSRPTTGIKASDDEYDNENIIYDVSQVVGDTIYYICHIYGDYSREEKQKAFEEFCEDVEADYGQCSFIESNVSPIYHE